MDTTKKNQQIIDLCKKMSYRKRVVFSDEGNLTGPKSIWDEFQYPYAKAKPNGLWYSFGPAWITLLTNDYKHQGETWEKKRLSWITHIYQISLRRSVIYCIDTEQKFDEFCKKYATKDGSGVRWHKVASDGWHGIEIRFIATRDSGWYEGWDCSSGCIWHPKAVRKIKTVASWQPSWS